MGQHGAFEREVISGLDLCLPRGASLGVVGRNGSGKTTLLRLLAGALQPSSGWVRLHGRVATLLDLGAGIDPDFSGRENALLLGILAGSSRRHMSGALDRVREFSGLGRAFDEPVRTYSAGMTLRLAFAAAVHSDPDILLIDEVLAVGDAFFQQRCLLRIRQLQAMGCTIVLVTHDLPAVLEFCDEALWLEGGRIAARGDAADVVRRYEGARSSDAVSLDRPLAGSTSDGQAEIRTQDEEIAPAACLANVDGRFGDGRVRIEGLELRELHDAPLAMPAPGRDVKVVMTFHCLDAIQAPIAGFILRDRLGGILGGENTSQAGEQLHPLCKGERVTVEFTFRWPSIASGSFAVCPAVADGNLDQHRICDWIDNAWVLEASNPAVRYGWLDLGAVGIRVAQHGKEG